MRTSHDIQLRVAIANVLKHLSDAVGRNVQQPLLLRRTFKPNVVVALIATPTVPAINVEVHDISHLVAVVDKEVGKATIHCY